MNVESASLGVLILAAGKGIRMHSDKPKVLQLLLEEPIVYYPLKAASDAGIENIAILVGHRGDMVDAYIRKEWPGVQVIWQDEQLGTGHAVMVAEHWWERFEHVLVVSGDVPLVRSSTLADLVEKHLKLKPQCSFISFLMDDPSGYGRVVRLADGAVRIIEDKDAVEEELLIQEINSGVYLFETGALSAVIRKLGRNNAIGEYNLTDAITMIGETEGDVNIAICEDQSELLGVNTPNDLAATAEVLNRRIVSKHMLNGLKCMDPRSTWIGPRVELEPDVFIEPGAQIWGKSHVSCGARVGVYSTLRNVNIGEGSIVYGPSVVSDTQIGRDVEIGPFACMRGDAEITDRARVGRFVEIKHSVVGNDARVPHLSYIGDAAIGERTNIGAGTITCNYDGENKHRTSIGAGCFVGSDTMFVAPVSMGDDSSTAAGSIVTRDVPEGAIAIARARQINIDNWRARKGLNPKNAEKKDDEEN
ncbi:MAG: bifunctional UDP-N-acetylglucosamine diphosphorylase/glucosamine-1-phosphate N-acetyltransferase GlmU [Synergistaceae bacterium]|jgi:bifunctional UDP-N-acetylglucosamine pyrophosphorylase/glucosamine-1-phosphate N-acetyltransferase|nr:bifunctional UDP-N-acetylglucosamine diphosphorylase/glucosamine-1-phosphate N-acetyltransferase GlmU [Synergistaceae bacterium]